MIDQDEIQMLIDARVKARRLVEALLRQQADIEANPPKLPPDQMADGRFAMNKAVESAQRMLDNLEQALAIAQNESTGESTNTN